MTKLCCDLCTFSEPSNINKYFAHLKTHLRNKETVKHPFADCSFKSSVLSTFTAHRSRYHRFSSLNSWHLYFSVCKQFYVSNSAVQEVIDELFEVFGDFAYKNIKKIIEKVLEKNNCAADAFIVTSLMKFSL